MFIQFKIKTAKKYFVTIFGILLVCLTATICEFMCSCHYYFRQNCNLKNQDFDLNEHKKSNNSFLEVYF